MTSTASVFASPTVNSDRVRRPLTRRGLWWAAVRDGRRRCLPENGSTPTVEMIATTARAAVADHRRTLQTEATELLDRRRLLVVELAAAERNEAEARRLVEELPDRPDEQDLPDRAVPHADPVLMASLRRSTAARDLRLKRAAANGALQQAVAAHDDLTARLDRTEERLRQLPSVLHAAAVAEAGDADVRTARYAATLRRWHRSPQQLASHLPFARLVDRLGEFEPMLTHPLTEDLEETP